MILLKRVKVLWRYARPHTIIGTTLSVLSLYVMADPRGVIHNWWVLGWALLCTWAGNVYIVGLNQIWDVEIDRINKPFLPIPAGDLSLKSANLIIIFALIIALSVSVVINKFLFLVLLISVLIGTAYSLPPLRLKRFPFLASLSILTVRGMVVNLGLSLYFTQEMYDQVFIPPVVWLITGFMILFSLIIAWFKDLPDVKGDRRFGIRTFSVQFGVRTVFRAGIILMVITYVGVLMGAFLLHGDLNRLFFAASHLVLLGILLRKVKKIDLNQKEEIQHFYQFIWKLFYLEYVIFAVAVIL